MKFNTKIPKHLKQAYNEEIKQYSLCLENKQFGYAWFHYKGEDYYILQVLFYIGFIV